MATSRHVHAANREVFQSCQNTVHGFADGHRFVGGALVIHA